MGQLLEYEKQLYNERILGNQSDEPMSAPPVPSSFEQNRFCSFPTPKCHQLKLNLPSKSAHKLEPFSPSPPEELSGDHSPTTALSKLSFESKSFTNKEDNIFNEKNNNIQVKSSFEKKSLSIYSSMTTHKESSSFLSLSTTSTNSTSSTSPRIIEKRRAETFSSFDFKTPLDSSSSTSYSSSTFVNDNTMLPTKTKSCRFDFSSKRIPIISSLKDVNFTPCRTKIENVTTKASYNANDNQVKLTSVLNKRKVPKTMTKWYVDSLEEEKQSTSPLSPTLLIDDQSSNLIPDLPSQNNKCERSDSQKTCSSSGFGSEISHSTTGSSNFSIGDDFDEDDSVILRSKFNKPSNQLPQSSSHDSAYMSMVFDNASLYSVDPVIDMEMDVNSPVEVHLTSDLSNFINLKRNNRDELCDFESSHDSGIHESITSWPSITTSVTSGGSMMSMTDSGMGKSWISNTNAKSEIKEKYLKNILENENKNISSSANEGLYRVHSYPRITCPQLEVNEEKFIKNSENSSRLRFKVSKPSHPALSIPATTSSSQFDHQCSYQFHHRKSLDLNSLLSVQSPNTLLAKGISYESCPDFLYQATC